MYTILFIETFLYVCGNSAILLNNIHSIHGKSTFLHFSEGLVHIVYINDELVKETEDVTYYISSLAYAEEYTLQQVVASLEDYWQIKTSHAVLDSHHLFHQDALHACLPTTIKNVAAFNKIGTAVLSYIRQRMSIKECRKKPHSYKLIKSRCQSMGLESLLIYLYDYWFDRVEQTEPCKQ